MSRHATVEKLSAYIDAELVDRELRALERHLADCQPCRDRLAGLSNAAARLSELAHEVPPAPLQRRVRRAVRGATVSGRLLDSLEEGVRGRLTQPIFGPAFAVVVALGAIIYLFAHGVAREQGRSGTRVVIQPGRAASEQTAAAAPGAAAGSVQVGERWLDLDGETWVERGLESGAPVERIEVTAGPATEELEIAGLTSAELDALRPLERVVVASGGRVVEIVWSTPPRSP